VRETVPDSIIDQADDVEIIDLTPDDLIKRLEEGKVYFPNTAQRAIENYFSSGNLTALRELALRRTAQRVDEQLLNHMQSHAIQGPWAAGRGCSSASTHVRAVRPAFAMHAGWPTGFVRHGRRFMSIRLASPACPRKTRTGSPRSCALPSSLAPR